MAENEKSLAVVETAAPTLLPTTAPVWTTAREQLIRDNFVPRDAPNDMIEAFLALARHRGLAPEEKHVYLIERGSKWTIQTGIDGFRLIADRTGTYAGSDPAVYTYDSGGKVESATITVWKMVQGQRCPFGATAYVADYTTGKLLWASMPRVMIAKVAESAALRKAFPAQLSGIYESSEMDQTERTPSSPATVRERPAAAATQRQPGKAERASQAQAQAVARNPDRPTPEQSRRLIAFTRDLGLTETQVVEWLGGPFGGRTKDQVETTLGELADETERRADEAAQRAADGPHFDPDGNEIDLETGEIIPDHVGRP